MPNTTVCRIDDPQDPRIADFRIVRDPELVRRRGLFIAESRDVVRRLLISERFVAKALLLTNTALSDLGEQVAYAQQIYVAEHKLLEAVSGYKVHRGCLAIGERPVPLDVAEILRLPPRLLIGLEAVTNPDNVGGIFRSAVAFGADGVLVSSRTADPLYRKAIRTSMGSTLRLPFATVEPWPDGLDRVRVAGMRIVAVTPDADAVAITDLESTVTAAPTLLLVGNEGDGLEPATRRLADLCVRIPMAGDLDSLNVTSAASIAMHHFARACRP